MTPPDISTLYETLEHIQKDEILSEKQWLTFDRYICSVILTTTRLDDEHCVRIPIRGIIDTLFKKKYDSKMKDVITDRYKESFILCRVAVADHNEGYMYFSLKDDQLQIQLRESLRKKN